MRTASVSDLKNNLSARLKSVIAGEPLVITDHRKPVAVVYPLEQDLMDEHVKSLVAEGLVTPPRRKPSARAVLDLPLAECNARLTEAVLEERGDDR
jgi:prevent-host-death family protein